VLPRQKLTIDAIVENRFGTSGAVAVTVRRDTTKVAEGELLLALAVRRAP
jgi:hypothetical protein